MRRSCVGTRRVSVLRGFRRGFRPPHDGNFVLLVALGVPLGVAPGVPLGVAPGVPPPHDGNFVLLVAPGVTGIIKKIWFWFLSFLFLYFVFLYFLFLLHCF